MTEFDPSTLTNEEKIAYDWVQEGCPEGPYPGDDGPRSLPELAILEELASKKVIIHEPGLTPPWTVAPPGEAA